MTGILDWIMVLCFIGLVGLLVLAWGRGGASPPPYRWPIPQQVPLPYQRKRFFFTRTEERFYRELRRIVATIGGQLTIMAKVRLADLVIMQQGTTGREYWAAWGRISQKHADFVLLRPSPEEGALTPVLVIELDDPTNERPDRRQRDALVDAIYAQCGLPIFHVQAAPRYDVDFLKTQIRQLTGMAGSDLGHPIPKAHIDMPPPTVRRGPPLSASRGYRGDHSGGG